MGENAGVVDVGDGWAVTFKIESHNHPSYVEPYQGAATGVGGIVRDILTMGARPIAVLDSLRFGPLDAPDTARVLPGVVAGIGGYGNCLGLPNIGGEVFFDDTYIGNPLVNALCVGVMRADGIKLAKADGPGNKVVLFGARTGGDGIGGASVLASARRSTTRSQTQAADRAGRRPVRREGAHRVLPGDLRRRPRRRHPGPRRGRAVLRHHRTRRRRHRRHGRRPRPRPAARPDARSRRDPDERVAGTDDGGRRRPSISTSSSASAPSGTSPRPSSARSPTSGRLRMHWHGETIVDLPPRTAAHDGPVYERPIERPLDQDALVQHDGAGLPRPRNADELRATVLRMAASPNLADKSWVTDQYDRYVLGNTVLAQPEDAGMIRLDESTLRGVAVVHRRQRPLHPPRPVRRRAARAGRGLPQRRRHRRPPARRHQLPQLRLARGPGGHVAVRRGGARARRRLPRARHPGHRRQRQLLQPDRDDRRSCRRR